MNLVGYTTTALSRNDIIDTPTNKNIVDGAIVELKDYDGNLVTIYDDINGTNPETQKTCDTNGQCTFFAEAGDYVLEVNGRPQNITISVNITVVNDVSSQRIWGDRYKGKLTADVGVTLADEFSVLLYDGNYYSYTGSDPFPVIVASGTVPTAPDYKLRNPTDHDSDINRNAAGSHDDIYTRNFKSVTDLRNQIDATGSAIDLSVLSGNKVYWRGYYQESDGGSNWGIVKTGDSTSLTDDGGSIFIIVNDAVNGVWVEANLAGKKVNVKKFGFVSGGAVDNSPFAESIANAGVNDIYIPNGDYLFTYGVDFNYPVNITTGGYAKITINNTIDYIFDFKNGCNVNGLSIDCNDFNVLDSAPILLAGESSFTRCNISNIKGLSSDFQQYAVLITPFDGEVNFNQCRFNNVTNYIGSIGSASRWSGFVFVYGSALNITKGFHLKFNNNTFDTCETVFPESFSESEKEEYMDSDAIRIFYEDVQEETKNLSFLTCKGNSFKNVQKRFYKPNSTECYIDGDYCNEGVRESGKPGMSHIAQLRGGASMTMVNCNFKTDIRNYPVVQYEMYKNLVIDNCNFTRNSLSTARSRLFFVIPDGTINADAKVIVNNVNLDGFSMLFIQGEGSPFLNINNVELVGADRLTSYEHTNSKGYFIRNLDAYLSNPNTESDDYGIYDRQSSSPSSEGVYMRNVNIFDLDKNVVSGFPNTIDMRSDKITLDSVKIYEEYIASSPFPSKFDVRFCNDLKILNCGARIISVQSCEKAYLANCYATTQLSGNTSETEHNTAPWYGASV